MSVHAQVLGDAGRVSVEHGDVAGAVVSMALRLCCVSIGVYVRTCANLHSNACRHMSGLAIQRVLIGQRGHLGHKPLEAAVVDVVHVLHHPLILLEVRVVHVDVHLLALHERFLFVLGQVRSCR